MFYILIYALLFFGVASMLVYLLSAFRIIHLNWTSGLMLLPGLLLGAITADAFLLGGVIVGNVLPSPMALYFGFGGLLLIPVNLILAALFAIAVWKVTGQRR